MTIDIVETHRSFGGVQGVYKHHSSTLSGEMEFSVFVPPQAHEVHAVHEAKLATLPVLYYLSGLTCTQDNVTGKGGFQRLAAELGLVVVCPDTSPRSNPSGDRYPGEDDDYDFGSGAGFYVDATREPWSENYKMYSYVVDELPEVIAANFPVDTGRSGIFGHSMGGHGALTIALKHPDKYRSVSAFAPIVAPMQVPWGRKAFTGYLGDDEAAWKPYDAVELIKEGRRTAGTILIDQGADDSFLAEQLRPELFEYACREAGQAVVVRMREGYDHSYYFISTFMADHLRHHAEQLSKPDS